MTLRQRLVQGAREPLVQFLAAGALIFAGFALLGQGPDQGDRRIVVEPARVERIVTLWMQTWHRPPTPAELDGLISEYVQEEVYVREALRLGLDGDDPVIRRRLRSKMEFLATDQLESATPDEGILQAWMQSHPGLYAQDPRVTFQQVYLGPAGEGADDAGQAASALARLQAGGDPDSVTLPLSLPRDLASATRSEIDRQFGDGFSEALLKATAGQWSGPVPSGFGVHLVRVSTVQAGKSPRLEDVRQAVENDWRAATRAEREAQAYQDLLKGYDVVIERPK